MMEPLFTLGNLVLSALACLLGIGRLFSPQGDMNKWLRLGFGLATVAAGLNVLLICLSWMKGLDAPEILQHKASEVSELLVYGAVVIIVAQFRGHSRRPYVPKALLPDDK